MTDQNEIVLYKPDETLSLDVRVADDTVWLSQQQMADLFGVNRQAVTKHLKNIFDTKELDQGATCSILELVQKEGNRMVRRDVVFYNLDAIISVGFRVNTNRGIQFRQWANKVLKDFMLRGYAINNRVANLEQRVARTEQQIEFFVQMALPPKEGVFFDGQIFDAYVLASDLVKRATKRVVLVDNYVDETVLALLDKRAEGVSAIIYTGNLSKQLKLDVEKHNAQYKPIEVKVFTQSHDRFLIIDDNIYHLGASLKDLGKKWFAFSKMNEISTTELINRLK